MILTAIKTFWKAKILKAVFWQCRWRALIISMSRFSVWKVIREGCSCPNQDGEEEEAQQCGPCSQDCWQWLGRMSSPRSAAEHPGLALLGSSALPVPGTSCRTTPAWSRNLPPVQSIQCTVTGCKYPTASFHQRKPVCLGLWWGAWGDTEHPETPWLPCSGA